MPSINYSFTTPANYIFDSSKIEVVGGVAQLKLTISGGQVFNEDFANDTGFIYDNTKAEFVGGQVQQKDITPANSLFAVNYAASVNLNWHKAGGSLIGTLNGVPILVGGKLVCTGTQGVYYSRNSAIVETHKFRFTPDYTTTPPTNINLVTTWNGSNNDKFLLTHSPSGNTLRLTLYNDISVLIIPVATAVGLAWEPTASTEYEFEVVVDSVLGIVRVFIDGILHGTNSPGAWDRGTAAMRYYMGASPGLYDTASGSFDDYIMFDDAQHTASYTPGYTIDPFIYVESEILLPVFVHAGLGTLISLDGLVTTETGSPRYSFEVDTFGHVYWNGSAWVPSNLTYAQANDVATANANLSSLTAAGEITFHVHVHFTDTNTQSNVDDLTVNHTANTIFDLTNPTIIPTTSFSQDALLTFIATITEPGSDSVRFAIRIDGQDKYWSGAAWVNADGTFSQTNDLATVQTNLAALIIRGVTLPIIYLHSDSGSTTPNIDDLTISFDFFGGPTIPENVCTVWGFLYDELNAPVVGVTILVTPTRFGLINDKVITKDVKTVVTDSTGYWEIVLIETETSGDNWAYTFVISGFKSTKLVPNLTSAEFNTLAGGFP